MRARMPSPVSSQQISGFRKEPVQKHPQEALPYGTPGPITPTGDEPSQVSTLSYELESGGAPLDWHSFPCRACEPRMCSALAPHN